MRSLGSLAVWALAASLASVGAVADAAASRVMKFAQVFLRENEFRNTTTVSTYGVANEAILLQNFHSCSKESKERELNYVSGRGRFVKACP